MFFKILMLFLFVLAMLCSVTNVCIAKIHSTSPRPTKLTVVGLVRRRNGKMVSEKSGEQRCEKAFLKQTL